MRKLICFLGNVFFVFKKRKLPKNIKKVLLLKIGAMGDVLMTTPLIRALDGKGFTVDYCVGNFSKDVLEGNKHLNKILSFDDTAVFKKNLGEIIKLIKKIRSGNYDAILVLDKSWMAGVLASLCGKFRIGFDRYGEGFANNLNLRYGPLKHEIEYYSELGHFLGVKKPKNLDLDLTLSDKDIKATKKFLDEGKLICIAPGGAKNPGQNMPTRRWPAKRFADVAEELVKKGYKIVLTGLSTDKEAAEPILKKVKVINAIGKLKLKESVALIKQCELLICNDAGPMHFASAVKTPSISIFGPTDPRRKAPLGKIHKYLWNKIDCTKEEVFAVYNRKEVRDNILNVKVKDVLEAIGV